jgi:predicted PurR-regulated permease PerM
MILAVFAGLGMFGFFGIVLGPVLMIILLTTIQMYLEVFTETKSIDRSVDVKKPNMARRLQFWRRVES